MNVLTPEKFLPDEPKFYDSEQIQEIFFKDTNPVSLFGGRMTIVDESLAQYVKKQYTTTVEDFTSDGSYMLDEVIITAKRSEKKGVNYRIFISDDGDKLNYLVNNSINGRPESDEILIYIEGDEDRFSKKIMQVIAGTQVNFNEKPFRYAVNSYTTIEDEDLKDLIASTLKDEKSFVDKFVYALAAGLKITNIGFEIVSSALGKGIKLIDKLKVDEKYYNPTDKKSNLIYDAFKGVDKYVLDAKSFVAKLNNKVIRRLQRKNKILGAIATRLEIAFKTLTDLLEYLISFFGDVTKAVLNFIQQQISLIIGVWNGLVDMISGLFFIIKLILEGGKLANKALIAAADFKNDAERKNAVLEQLDNVIDKLTAVDFKEVFNAILDQISIFNVEIDLNEIASYLKKQGKVAGKKVKSALTFTAYELYYYIGYIATFFIPVAWIAALLGKGGKLGKLLGGTLKWVDDLMAKVFGIALRGLQRSAQPFTDILRALAKKLQGGTQTIRNSIEEVIKSIKSWLDDVLPGWRVGTGNDYKTLQLLSRKVFGQEWKMSCAAAAVRQLSDDFGIKLSEKKLRKLLETDKILGTDLDQMKIVLKKVFKDKNKKVDAGYFKPKPNQNNKGLAEYLCKERAPWIANIAPPGSKGHTIIVDGLVDGKIKIRDPWPLDGKIGENGIEGFIDFDEFMDLWVKGGVWYGSIF